ncbi:MAG: hypothetical protein GY862_09940, partial [Gammaproteobacteria bacterium]|nr:hypothetical protein [Gammaproteobacteria bacterium]
MNLLVLNELSDEPHNVPLKCFASRRAEIRKAYRVINENRLPGQTLRLEQMFNGLYRLLSDKGKGEEEMKTYAETDELTLEHVLETGKEWIDHVWSLMPIEERLKGLEPGELLKGLNPEDRIKGLEPGELLKGLNPGDLLKGLGPEELIAGLTPEQLN